MQQFQSLIQSYIESEMNSETVKTWYSNCEPSSEEITGLAEHIGKRFAEGEINYIVASGLFNQLMPLVGFEAAPARFWQYYIALENAETLGNAEESAKKAVIEVVNHVAA